jgi:hypothetical protein
MELAGALHELNKANQRIALEALLEDPDVDVRRVATKNSYLLEDGPRLTAVRRAVGDPDGGVRKAALESIAHVGSILVSIKSNLIWTRSGADGRRQADGDALTYGDCAEQSRTNQKSLHAATAGHLSRSASVAQRTDQQS